MAADILKVNNLKTYYKTVLGKKIHAVDDVSFSLKEGEIVGIAGESGCGKSTLAVSLMNLYMGALKYESGAIVLGETDITALDRETCRKEIVGKKIAYIPQAAMNALNPTLKIKNFIFDIMKEHKPELSKKAVYEMARERFESLNLEPRVLESFPNELSGGMKQRTVTAISTILNPDILVADEPTSALDVSSQKKVIKMLKSLMRRKIIKSMIFITHELPLLNHIADRIIVMYAGQIVEKGLTKDVIFRPFHPYAKELMRSIVVPESGTKSKQLSAIPGAPPNLKYRITGCRFAARCSFVRSLCTDRDIIEIEADRRQYKCLLQQDEMVVQTAVTERKSKN